MATENSDLSPRRRPHAEVNPPSPMISKLGDDLLLEILIRLPNPTSACRSKAVCKQWRSLVSKPCFSRRFISHHQGKNKPPPPRLLLPDDSLSFLPMPADSREHFSVFDCFKDLLLCGFWEPGDGHTDPQLPRSYLLCNPFTQQWVALPLAPERPVGLTAWYPSLVCEPLIPSESDSLDLGGGHAYRFRVVCIYQNVYSVKVDVFCSESGEWMEDALVLDGHCPINDVISCGGVLYVSYLRAQDWDDEALIVGFNPFHPDVPPTPIDVSPISVEWRWNISVSQGALHLIVFEEGADKPAGSMVVLSVWRLDEDCRFWRKVCQGPVKSSSGSGDNYRLKTILFPTLHPDKPEIVFFTHLGGSGEVHVSCDLTSGGELEFVANASQYFTGWIVFQPKVDCWPTPIPRYQKLRVMYDGSYSCWVQSNERITLPQ